ncbi:AraC family transcriptional regulator [Roseiarcus fermentans]|uniref:AraC family transcriptional regulator n=1 Tax=Roseiarcus fermentans TaxID=1473586 RepID=A0A366EMY4_9HYPH|nr:helix-turn-helix domain-containing protein [Roseiarcus fermentans]RBP02815.1 AraC family transcriptional regulator [Roseiarcus fermentans]
MTAPSASRPAARRRPAAIPSFSLYGEDPEPGRERLHIEDIPSRSRLYDWEIRPHVHHGLYQTVWLARGGAAVALDEWRGEVAAPAAVIAPPGVVHGFRFAPDADGHVLTLSARFLVEGEAEASAAFRALFLAPGVVTLPRDDPAVGRIDGLVRQLAAEFASPGAAASPAPAWLARAVVWRLAEARDRIGRASERGHRHQALFSRFLLLVEAHLLERWPLERYAVALGLSTQRLNRLARAESGRSALEIVHERLTREACRKLTWIAAPAETLAAELGFDDPAYFNRFFKRRTGLTPRAWRERQRAAP